MLSLQNSRLFSGNLSALVLLFVTFWKKNPIFKHFYTQVIANHLIIIASVLRHRSPSLPVLERWENTGPEEAGSSQRPGRRGWHPLPSERHGKNWKRMRHSSFWHPGGHHGCGYSRECRPSYGCIPPGYQGRPWIYWGLAELTHFCRDRSRNGTFLKWIPF